MIYAIENNGALKECTEIPHRQVYNRYRSRLTTLEFDAIFNELTSRITGTSIVTAGWLPGSDWTGTPFQPLFNACDQDFDVSRKMFGIIVWIVVQTHHASWSFGRYSVNGVPIESMTYFRISSPNTARVRRFHSPSAVLTP
jgi:hypothetical protein